MKLLSLKKDCNYVLGVKVDEGIIDLSDALLNLPSESRLPTEVMDYIGGDKQDVNRAIAEYIDKYLDEVRNGNAQLKAEENLELGPCVPNPGKIICVGLNYQRHAEETNSQIPEYPILFNKFSNSLSSHNEEIIVPETTKQLDYEAELAIVIGKTAKNISRENALDYVLGYCIANDLSARDLQLRTSQWLLGKSCDNFCPIGPYLVTSDDVGNPNNLSIKTFVNGELRQNSNTSDMIFYCDEIVSYISQYMSLEPGDVILTGTPEGVVMGQPIGEQNYLKPGDTVTIEIEKLGSLTNKFK